MKEFGYTPTIKTIESMPDHTESKNYNNVLTAFIQAEEKDQEDAVAVKRKLLKNLKWVAGKNDTKHIVLHSFAHLSESKAEIEFTKNLFDEVAERLTKSDYQVEQTPFGYFLDLKIDAPGFSLARVFKDI
jgi:hypothetical protein